MIRRYRTPETLEAALEKARRAKKKADLTRAKDLQQEVLEAAEALSGVELGDPRFARRLTVLFDAVEAYKENL